LLPRDIDHQGACHVPSAPETDLQLAPRSRRSAARRNRARRSQV